jgi:hypothetical protein
MVPYSTQLLWPRTYGATHFGSNLTHRNSVKVGPSFTRHMQCVTGLKESNSEQWACLKSVSMSGPNLLRLCSSGICCYVVGRCITMFRRNIFPISWGYYSSNLKKEATRSSKTLVPIYYTKRRPIAAGCHISIQLSIRHAYNKMDELASYCSLRFFVLPADLPFRCWLFWT